MIHTFRITPSSTPSQQLRCLSTRTVGRISHTRSLCCVTIQKYAFKQAHSRIFQDNEEPSNSTAQRRS